MNVPMRFEEVIRQHVDPKKPAAEQGVFDAELEAFIFFLPNDVTVDVTHVGEGRWSISVNDGVDCFFDSKGFRDDEESAARLRSLLDPEYVEL